MMNVSTQSVIAHPETKKVITLFTKADKTTGEEKTYGRVRIDSTVISMVNGYQRRNKRTAFVVLDPEVLPLMAPHIVADKPYPINGKVIVLETLEPQYEGHVPKMNPTTQEYVKVNGNLVYRTTEFTTDMSAQDTLVNQFNTPAIEESNEDV